ncbi:hypothetical protein AX16_009752 [Volvariella volvacea WC 439]|nr:hypothetical protein AX16_009752 [Volvariella volvacea WC 439]
MSAPSPSRGELALQPNYFTSSLFVKPFKDDIVTLIHAYHELYSKGANVQPFPLFKEVYTAHGWVWLHFKVIERRGREAFLQTVTRLLLERMVRTEPPFIRVVVLFALYTFFYTQPKETHPPLHFITNIAIPLDLFASLRSLPETLTTSFLLPFGSAVSHILSKFFGDNVFALLPSSEFGALNPRTLPREVLVDEVSPFLAEEIGQKKKGHPSRRERARKSRIALSGLDKWLKSSAHISSTSPSGNASDATRSADLSASLNTYHTYKTSVLDYLEFSHVNGTGAGTLALERANHQVLARLRAAQDATQREPSGRTQYGIDRVEQVVKAMQDHDPAHRGGLLSLLSPGQADRQ